MCPELADAWAAINKATTWADFKARVSPRLYREAAKRYVDELAELTRRELKKYGLPDEHGVPPAWPFPEGMDLLDRGLPIPHGVVMQAWLPKGIVEESGVFSTGVWETLFSLDLQRKDEILQALRDLGYECIENQDAINAASGS